MEAVAGGIVQASGRWERGQDYVYFEVVEVAEGGEEVVGEGLWVVPVAPERHVCFREDSPAVRKQEAYAVASREFGLVPVEEGVGGIVGLGHFNEDEAGAWGVVAEAYAGGWEGFWLGGGRDGAVDLDGYACGCGELFGGDGSGAVEEHGGLGGVEDGGFQADGGGAGVEDGVDAAV